MHDSMSPTRTLSTQKASSRKSNDAFSLHVLQKEAKPVSTRRPPTHAFRVTSIFRVFIGIIMLLLLPKSAEGSSNQIQLNTALRYKYWKWGLKGRDAPLLDFNDDTTLLPVVMAVLNGQFKDKLDAKAMDLDGIPTTPNDIKRLLRKLMRQYITLPCLNYTKCRIRGKFFKDQDKIDCRRCKRDKCGVWASD